MLRFSGVGVTDVGRVREHNEDSAFLGPRLALVADGVGGAAAGEVASATTAHVVVNHLMGQRLHDVAQVLTRAVDAATESIVRGVEADPRRAGMATTLTALATDGRQVVMAHVGDSRAYRLNSGGLSQLSTDHTYVQQLLDHGQIEAGAARRHPWRHVVLKSISAAQGASRDTLGGGADIVTLDVEPGDRLLVCSDGLTDLVTDDQIAELLREPDPRTAGSALVASALDAGGTDNVTCLVLDLLEGPRGIGEAQLLGAVRDPRNIAGSVAGTGTLPA